MMSYALEISEKLDRILKRLKNRQQLVMIDKKTEQILKNPYHFKPLSGNQHGERRVHINTHFVLTYEIDEQRRVVRLLDFEHHERVFR